MLDLRTMVHITVSDVQITALTKVNRELTDDELIIVKKSINVSLEKFLSVIITNNFIPVKPQKNKILLFKKKNND